MLAEQTDRLKALVCFTLAAAAAHSAQDDKNRVKCERARNTSHQDREKKGDKEEEERQMPCECGNGKASSRVVEEVQKKKKAHAQDEEATFSFALSSRQR